MEAILESVQKYQAPTPTISVSHGSPEAWRGAAVSSSFNHSKESFNWSFPRKPILSLKLCVQLMIVEAFLYTHHPNSTVNIKAGGFSLKFPRARENISLPSNSSQYVGVYPRSCMTVWLLLGLVSSGMGLLASWDITFICAQLYLTFCNPMDCSLPGSSDHGIFQARILEWVAISYSRGSMSWFVKSTQSKLKTYWGCLISPVCSPEISSMSLS